MTAKKKTISNKKRVIRRKSNPEKQKQEDKGRRTRKEKKHTHKTRRNAKREKKGKNWVSACFWGTKGSNDQKRHRQQQKTIGSTKKYTTIKHLR